MAKTILTTQLVFYLLEPLFLDCIVLEKDGNGNCTEFAHLEYREDVSPGSIKVHALVQNFGKYGQLDSLFLQIEGSCEICLVSLKATAEPSVYELNVGDTAFFHKYRGHYARVGLMFCHEAKRTPEGPLSVARCPPSSHRTV